MTAVRWQQIEQLYHSALRREGGERASYLSEVCAGDDALRRQVESLLKYAEDSGSFLEGRALEAAARRCVSALVPDLCGEMLGRYKVMARVGAGGMGQVYRAQDTRLKREVALKVLPPDAMADPGRRRRFEDEARAASALNHPNIVTVHDIDRVDGTDFIAMEYVPGKTLAELIDGKGLPIRDALTDAVQIAGALAAAHRAGIVHRDLKPANIMVNGSGQVKVLDFGLAKLTEKPGLEDTTSTRTSPLETDPGMIVGTAAYMSPEQAEGKEVDARSDIFSFGAVLYEMLTGRRAFQKDSSALTLVAILTEDPKPAGELVRNLPPEIENVLATCLRKQPEGRFQNTGDLEIALKDGWDAASGAPRRVRKRRRKMLRALPLVGVPLLAVAAWFAMPDRPQPQPVTVPLTTYPGGEGHPSFSPTGKEVAFTWDGPQQDNNDIYVKLIGGAEKPLRITTDPAQDTRPAWSPDGLSIAFLRYWGGMKSGVFLVPALGGPERKLTETGFVEEPSLRWSPDGKWLVYTDRDTANQTDRTSSIYALSIETGERRRLTTAPRHTGDYWGVLSPDGRTLAFSRESKAHSSELYLLTIAGNLRPEGEPRRVTSPRGVVYSEAWTPDGRDIVFVEGTSASNGLWRVRASGSGAPQRLWFAGDHIGNVAVSPRGNRLAYEQNSGDLDIWRLDLKGEKEGKPVKLIASTWSDTQPQYSPDGSRIAFDSTRSGYNEVWVCRNDGSDPVQLTFLQGDEAGPPRWSPDGKRIVFCYSITTDFDVYVIDAGGGQPRRLTDDPADDSLASFSHDGRWIYFTSSRTGRLEMWKMQAEGGKPVQLTRSGGWVGFESPDGKYLYYATNPWGATLYRIPVDGGTEQRIAEPFWGVSLVVAKSGLYHALPSPRGPVIYFRSFSTGRTTTVATIPSFYWFMSVSPDERYLLYSMAERTGSDLMLGSV